MKHSVVWKYFKRLTVNDAVCTLCLKNFRTGGGTTNLRQHLKSKHPQCFLRTTVQKLALSRTDEDEIAVSNLKSLSSTLLSSDEQNTIQAAGGGKHDADLTNALIIRVAKDGSAQFVVDKEGLAHSANEKTGEEKNEETREQQVILLSHDQSLPSEPQAGPSTQTVMLEELTTEDTQRTQALNSQYILRSTPSWLLSPDQNSGKKKRKMNTDDEITTMKREQQKIIAKIDKITEELETIKSGTSMKEQHKLNAKVYSIAEDVEIIKKDIKEIKDMKQTELEISTSIRNGIQNIAHNMSVLVEIFKQKEGHKKTPQISEE